MILWIKILPILYHKFNLDVDGDLYKYDNKNNINHIEMTSDILLTNYIL